MVGKSGDSNLPYSKRLEISTIYGNMMTYRIVHAWYRHDLPEDCIEQKESNLWERRENGEKE